MKRAGIVMCFALAIAVVPSFAADEYTGKTEGPYMSIELIEVQPYGNSIYYEYLGKGYIPMLAKAKAAGFVLDYGVLEYQTGTAGQGNLVIWWTTESLDDMQKAGEMMQKMVAEMRTPAEWKEMTDAVAGVRAPLSSNIARAVVWTKKTEAE